MFTVKLDKPSACPVCNAIHDGASPVDGGYGCPVPGNLSICAYCRTFLAYSDDLSLRELSEDEIAELSDEARIELQRVRAALRKLDALIA